MKDWPTVVHPLAEAASVLGFIFALILAIKSSERNRGTGALFAFLFAAFTVALVTHRGYPTEMVGTGGAVPTSEPQNPQVQGSSVVTVSVPGDAEWTDTGVDVQGGRFFTITAGGAVRFAVAGPPLSPSGEVKDCLHLGVPIYRWTFPAPGLSCHSLVGKVGPSGAIFEVGSGGRFRVTTPGRLYLGVNDNYFPDNSGSWTAEISAAPGRP